MIIYRPIANLFAPLIILAVIINSTNAWDSAEMEIFDAVEEINQNFYEVLGISQVSLENFYQLSLY